MCAATMNANKNGSTELELNKKQHCHNEAREKTTIAQLLTNDDVINN